MNKLLKYISVIILLTAISLLFVSSVYADDESTEGGTETKVDWITKLVEEEKKKGTDFVAKDLYIDIYQETTINPRAKALETTAAKFGVTPSQMNGMVSGADLSPIIAKGSGLESIDAIQNKYIKILGEFQQQYETESFRSELEQAVKPSEIFSDGDTSNSDFDLIYDLEIIEIILFNETSAQLFGNDFELPEKDKEKLEDELIEDLLGGDDDETTIDDDITESTTQTEDGINPLECFEGGSGLDDSINEFDEQQAGEDSSGQGAGDDDDDDDDDDGDEFPSADPDEWPTEFLCPDGAPFCIEITLDMGEAKVFQKTDNCVACHVQKINEALDKVIKAPISPNKLTGEIMEMPKCKSNFKNLPANMKIIQVSVPLPQPQNKDIYFQADINKSWQKFNETYKPFWYSKTEEAEKADLSKVEPTVAEKAVKKAGENITEETTLEEVNQKASNTQATITQQVEESKRVKKRSTTTEKQNTYYQTIMREFSNMNGYFKSMKENYEKIIDPTNKLLNKSKCS